MAKRGRGEEGGARAGAALRAPSEDLGALQRHARRFGRCADAARTVRRYERALRACGDEELQRLASHVAAWVACSRPRDAGALVAAAELLLRLLPRLAGARCPRLARGLGALEARLQDAGRPAAGDAVWGGLREALRAHRAAARGAPPSARRGSTARSGAPAGSLAVRPRLAVHPRRLGTAPGVRARILQPPWSAGKADGKKWFECVVARGTMRMNPLKSFQDGHMVVFGEAGTRMVDGVAVVEGEPRTQCKDRSILKRMLLMGDSAAALLDEYLDTGQSFHFLAFRCVYDLRRLALSWANLCDQVGCRLPGQWCGFPGLAGAGSPGALRTFLEQRPGIVLHTRPSQQPRCGGTGAAPVAARVLPPAPGARAAGAPALEAGHGVAEREAVARGECSAATAEPMQVTALFVDGLERRLQAARAAVASPGAGPGPPAAALRQLRRALRDAAGALADPLARSAQGASGGGVAGGPSHGCGRDDPPAIQQRLRACLIVALQVWREELWLEDDQIEPQLTRLRALISCFEAQCGSLDAAGAKGHWKRLKLLAGTIGEGSGMATAAEAQRQGCRRCASEK